MLGYGPIYSLLSILQKPDWEKILTSDPLFCSVKRSDDPAFKGMSLIKYNQIETRWMDPVADAARACRGIIIEDPQFLPIAMDGGPVARVRDAVVRCYAFDKFFNYQEGPADKLDIFSTTAREKIDGSLIKLWPHFGAGHDWIWATNGGFDASARLPGFPAIVDEESTQGAETFDDLVVAAVEKAFDMPFADAMRLFESRVPPKFTVAHELTSPRNRIVLKYEETELWLLGARDLETFEEMTPEAFKATYDLPYRVPKKYSFGAPSEVLFKDDVMHEGVVFCDRDFARVKAKTEDYVAMHRLKGEDQFSDKRLWDCFLADALDDVTSAFPEYREKIDAMISYAILLRNTIQNAAIEARAKWATLGGNRKDYAVWVLGDYRPISSALFDMLKHEDWEPADVARAFIKGMKYDDFVAKVAWAKDFSE
jgi:hypothetical protein